MIEIEKALRQKLNQDSGLIPQECLGGTAAAVLILLVKVNDQWNIIYTRRTNGVRTHQGEVSFPGGAYEKSDSSLVQTALREANEEIGVRSESITVLGGLAPYTTISKFRVYPFIGILNGTFEFTINKDEVGRVFFIPVDWLNNPKNYYIKEHIINDIHVTNVIHYVDFDGEHLWGFTARVTQQILELIE